jgi:hypothetical protein
MTRIELACRGTYHIVVGQHEVPKGSQHMNKRHTFMSSRRALVKRERTEQQPSKEPEKNID